MYGAPKRTDHKVPLADRIEALSYDLNVRPLQPIGARKETFRSAQIGDIPRRHSLQSVVRDSCSIRTSHSFSTMSLSRFTDT